MIYPTVSQRHFLKICAINTVVEFEIERKVGCTSQLQINDLMSWNQTYSRQTSLSDSCHALFS